MIGFDDFGWASVFRPRPTTVRQPVYEPGKAATRRLIKRIEDQRTGPAIEVVLPPTLIISESCGEALGGRGPASAPAAAI